MEDKYDPFEHAAKVVEGLPAWLGGSGGLEKRIVVLEKEKNAAYSERNQLVAFLSKLFPASLERHPDEDEDWEDDWRWIVFIDLPCGQATWHIHDSQLNLFYHLPRYQRRVWDGHTTEQKYERMSKWEDVSR